MITPPPKGPPDPPRRSPTVLTGIGVVLFVAALVYGLMEVQRLKGEIEQKEAALAALSSSADSLRAEIDHIMKSPLEELIEIKSIGVPRYDLPPAPEGTLYNFMVGMELPYARKADIEEVRYNFNERTMLNRQPVSREPSNGFAHGYLGWGLLNNVPITVVPRGDEAAFVINYPLFRNTQLIDPGS